MSVFGRGLASVLGVGGKAFKHAPIGTSVGLAPLAGDVGGGLLEFIGGLDLTGGGVKEQGRLGRVQSDVALMFKNKQRAMQKLRTRNLGRVAAYLPDTYHQVSAGRRLPKGSVVIGGRPRIDLLKQLADSMGSGEFEGA